jgi:hypothetical protein
LYSSIGEAIFSPRLIDFTIASAPEGKEAIYLGLANLPNSVSLFITGMSSGFFMSNFCPQQGEKHCELVWLFIGLYCIVTCFVIVLGRNFFEIKKSGKFQNTKVEQESIA